MTPQITITGICEFTVADARRVYGRYRTLRQAERRVEQIATSRRKKVVAAAASDGGQGRCHR